MTETETETESETESETETATCRSKQTMPRPRAGQWVEGRRSAFKGWPEKVPGANLLGTWLNLYLARLAGAIQWMSYLCGFPSPHERASFTSLHFLIKILHLCPSAYIAHIMHM